MRADWGLGTAASESVPGHWRPLLSLQSAHISHGHALGSRGEWPTTRAATHKHCLSSARKTRQSVWTCTELPQRQPAIHRGLSHVAELHAGPEGRTLLHLAYSHSHRAKDGLISPGGSSAPGSLRRQNAPLRHQSFVFQLSVPLPTSYGMGMSSSENTF